jgi:predicted transcriptional regulator of viral defense system
MEFHRDKIMNLMKHKGMIRPRDLDEHCIPHKTLWRLYKHGEIVRVGRGLYQLPGAKVTEHHSLTEVSKRIPHGVVCLLSALRFHGISTQSPFEVWLAIDRKAHRPKKTGLPVRIVYFSGESLTKGVEYHRIEGVPVKVYNPAKTVADCFKYRNKIGLDVAMEALKDCWRTRKCTMDDLWLYAGICRVANIMRPYMETLTL